MFNLYFEKSINNMWRTIKRIEVIGVRNLMLMNARKTGMWWFLALNLKIENVTKMIVYKLEKKEKR